MSKTMIIKIVLVVTILVVGLSYFYLESQNENEDQEDYIRFKVENNLDQEIQATFHIDDEYDGEVYVKPGSEEWYTDGHCKAGEMHNVWFSYKINGDNVWHNEIFDTDQDVTIVIHNSGGIGVYDL